VAVAGSEHGPGDGAELTVRPAEQPTDGWGTAIVKSAVILALALVGFGVVPDRLVTYLSRHMSPTGRDLLVSLWVLVFFVFLCWLYVRLQRPRAAR
jgi:hypothetical protein